MCEFTLIEFVSEHSDVIWCCDGWLASVGVLSVTECGIAAVSSGVNGVGKSMPSVSVVGASVFDLGWAWASGCDLSCVVCDSCCCAGRSLDLAFSHFESCACE